MRKPLSHITAARPMNEVDVYILACPPEAQEVLENIRRIILKAAPDAWEGMAYGMPAYKTRGKPLVYMAAYKNHIGFYATPSGHKLFEAELAAYKQGKGSVQFPLNKTIPYDLIERMVRFRVEENASKQMK